MILTPWWLVQCGRFTFLGWDPPQACTSHHQPAAPSPGRTCLTGEFWGGWQQGFGVVGHRVNPGLEVRLASANARKVAGGQLACMRATQCGTHAGHTMRDGCKRANRQVGGRERDRSWGQRHHVPHGHGQGMDTATGSDAFGTTSWPRGEPRARGAPT